MLDSTISVLHKNGLRESNEAFQNLAADSKNFNKDIMDWTIFNQSEIGNILLVVRPSCHCCSHRRPSTVAFCSVHTWIEPTLPLPKKKALWQSQWRPCGKFAAALPQTHCKVAAVSFYHANEPSCRFAINLPQPCGKIIYVNYPLAKLRHSVTLHICFLAMLWHTNQFINIHGNLLANLRHTLP